MSSCCRKEGALPVRMEHAYVCPYIWFEKYTWSGLGEVTRREIYDFLAFV